MPYTYSCSVFLKEIARGDEHRSKHHQDVGAYSSDPSTKSKKLTKRPRPSNYQEESSPKVSPPRGDTPDETECLKMYFSEILLLLLLLLLALPAVVVSPLLLLPTPAS
jgi:hypothetical protein